MPDYETPPPEPAIPHPPANNRENIAEIEPPPKSGNHPARPPNPQTQPTPAPTVPDHLG